MKKSQPKFPASKNFLTLNPLYWKNLLEFFFVSFLSRWRFRLSKMFHLRCFDSGFFFRFWILILFFIFAFLFRSIFLFPPSADAVEKLLVVLHDLSSVLFPLAEAEFAQKSSSENVLKRLNTKLVQFLSFNFILVGLSLILWQLLLM